MEKKSFSNSKTKILDIKNEDFKSKILVFFNKVNSYFIISFLFVLPILI